MARGIDVGKFPAAGAIFFILYVIGSCQPSRYGDASHLQLFRRSVLDQKTRMITLGYDRSDYLAYDLKNMVPYQFWNGGVLWNGAVFNNIKTVQPASYGHIYWQLKDPSIYWRVMQEGRSISCQVQFEAYELVPQDQITFHYTLLFAGKEVMVKEIPAVYQHGDSVFYERNFSFGEVPANTRIYISGHPVDREMRIREGFKKIQTPGRPGEVTSGDGAQYWLDRSGCNTCHQMEESNIGPAYRQIAERYDREDEDLLIQSVVHGQTGKWGQAQMIPHPDMDERDIRNMVRYILSLVPDEKDQNRARETVQVETVAPKSPGFGAPLEAVHPSFDLISIRPETFRPRVGGMHLMDNGKLLISTWDSVGAVYQIMNLEDDDPESTEVKMIASGLAEPLGITTVDEKIFVLQKHELTQLIDTDGDDVTDQYVCICDDFMVTPDFHEFSYGLVHHQGKFYGGLGLAMRLMSSELQLEDRGTVFSVDMQGNFEIIARGLRQPNGIGVGPDDEIFVTENQGQWVPACKLIQVQRDHFYGCQFGTGDRFKDEKETLPAVYLPQDEIGNSPGQPVLLKQGPYAGQMIFGDVSHGGIKRAFLEKIDGEYQGCVFRFCQGLEAGINRLAIDDEGNIYTGGVGMNGGWAHKEHQFGLEKLKYNGNTTFEILALRINPSGFQVEFTSPLSRDIPFDRSKIKVAQWRYEATEKYGGPKIDEEELPIEKMEISDDRKIINLKIPGVKEGYVVYFYLDENLRDINQHRLWSGETWYTVKSLPEAAVPL